MNYFTPAWHKGDLEEEVAGKMFGEYQRHLAVLLPNLPSEVQTLATHINIHDGLLWKAEANPGQDFLRLALRCGDSQVGYFDLELEYHQVDFGLDLMQALGRVSVVRLDQPSVPYPNEAMYDEVDQEDDYLVHRVLFLRDLRGRRQARRHVLRQRMQRRPQRRRRVMFPHNNYQELTIRFKQLRVQTTPQESRHSIADQQLI